MSLSMSNPTWFTYNEQPAVMRVMRADGWCWGRMVVRDRYEFDIIASEERDDTGDDTAIAQMFIDSTANPDNVQPAGGYFLT